MGILEGGVEKKRGGGLSDVGLKGHRPPPNQSQFKVVGGVL